MTAEWLLAWFNLIYVVPFLLALLYLVVYVSSGLAFGETDVDTHADVDAHAEVGADAGMHVDADADAHADWDGDAEAGGDAHAHVHTEAEGDGDRTVVHLGDAHTAADVPFYLKTMGWLGLGRVPLSITLMVLLLTWGLIGFVVNNLLRGMMPLPGLVVLASLPAAALGSTAFTRGVVRVMGRWMPTTETYAPHRADLVGEAGEALFTIDRAFGMAIIRDHRGDLFQVPCRVYEDGQPIAKGKRVLLVDYNSREHYFYVTESDLELETGGQKLEGGRQW